MTNECTAGSLGDGGTNSLYYFNFTIYKLYLIFCRRCNARSSSSFNERPVSKGWSSRGRFLSALSGDFFLFKGRNLW